MSGVIGKLQSLVSIVVTPSTQRSISAPQDYSQSPRVTDTPTLTPSGCCLELEKPTGRPRRQTDVTVDSISTVVSVDAPATLTASRQDVEKLLPHRMPDLERISRLHPVRKFLQQDSWDCGLACVCMILRAFGYTTCSIPQLIRQAKTDSIWTIDLVFLLNHYLQADFTYYTKYAGINPEHTTQAFYKDGLDADEARVQRLFTTARWEGIGVLEIAIPLLDLKRFLVHRQYVGILLVDSTVLRCVACERARTTRGGHVRSKSMNMFRPKEPEAAHMGSGLLGWFSRRRPLKDRDGYLGHYILLIAYIPSLDMFLYRDPGIPEEFCVASAQTIDSARSRPGTDMDCIILKLK